MSLATATREGRPSLRSVVFEHLDATEGFVFYTSTESRKARELAQNPWAALAFYWPMVERQVRIEGPVTALTAEENDACWRNRPLEERIADAAAAPAEQVHSRAAMLAAYEDGKRKALAAEAAGTFARPAVWGAYRVRPLAMEFWRGDDGRLHDRFRYKRDDLSAPWRVIQLWP
jgi:pyridoxamine 5'-phosphate oxidase